MLKIDGTNYAFAEGEQLRFTSNLLIILETIRRSKCFSANEVISYFIVR